MARETALTFEDLPGWAEDDAAAAFTCFRRSAEAIVAERPALRPGVPPGAALIVAARAALQCPTSVSCGEARTFFETWFRPVAVDAVAFFTGYYQPEVEGALTRSDRFAAPILARPADLVTLDAAAAQSAGLEGLAAARVDPEGHCHPYPVRAVIERDAVVGLRPTVVWLRDWVEVFLIHVQGSARVRLPDGSHLRLTYAGRNGHPYTSIGRLLVEAGEIAPEAMSLDGLKAWLRANGQDEGERGRALMQRNVSYIFFEGRPDVPGEEPIAGQGIGLTPLRSIAVDRTVWAYGQPFWLAADLPWSGSEPAPFRRLVAAQDVGSAIVGPARADLFFGSGESAGTRAGGIRHGGSLVELRPRADCGVAP